MISAGNRNAGISGPGQTMGSLTIRALRRYPERLAFSWDGGRLSYAGAADLIGRYQHVLQRKGLGRGSTLAILAGNRAEAWCIGAAAHASGIATSWLHPMGSFDDQMFQIRDAEVDGVVVDERHHSERAGQLAAACVDDVTAVFSFGPCDFACDLEDLANSVGSSRAVDLASRSDIAVIAYTGGTTGKPKGVMRRHASAVRATAGILSDFEIPDSPRYLSVAPLSHVGGSKVLSTFIRGGSVHLINGFTPERVFAAIERERSNFTLLVPSMIYSMLDDPAIDGADLSSLELILYGASPMSPSRLMEGLDRVGPVFSQLYGQTECYPIALLKKSDHDPSDPDLLSSCGFPLSPFTVSVRDAEGQEVPTGELGEVCVRDGATMDGYWKNDELTAETLVDGWLHTGDIARADDRGYLYIVDRKKDMIISGGFNVYPKEVEDALTSHESVSSAAVYGTPDDKWGEAVTASVVLRPGAIVDESELVALVKQRKGSVQAPKRIHIVDSLPLTALGKVDKKALRDQPGP
ncbi:AMP-binding protein [Rhodococcus sp. OK302]|uniref:AMP-binding protein n=1 Tax=Rhodococcus sp. OK302 TaxID=1882769 RepID=UPI000B9F8B69|nr:AMP-binding protein [Rhodococcus sp. OK302]OYD68027.1 fatty-acyl-CoA synthase [Rhodococcus sp. OK302]